MLESGDLKGWGLEAMEDTWSKSQGGAGRVLNQITREGNGKNNRILRENSEKKKAPNQS